MQFLSVDYILWSTRDLLNRTLLISQSDWLSGIRNRPMHDAQFALLVNFRPALSTKGST